MKAIKIVDLLKGDVTALIEKEVNVKGWVRTKRGNKNVAFVAINDGSTIHNIQAVFDLAAISEEQLKDVTTGAGVSITGKLLHRKDKVKM